MRNKFSLQIKALGALMAGSLFSANLSAQTQVGADILGGASGIHMQMANALSANGLTVAVGASWTSSKAGAVRVFELVSGTWTQKGSSIIGEAPNDESGTSVSLSANGLTVAIGAPNNSGNGASAGHVRIYRWNGSAWAQLGGDIDGVAAGDLSGTAISLSADGNSVIVGAHSNNGAANTQTDIGMARVFSWNGSAWTQKGSTIYGENIGDFFGYSVSMSANGNRIAVGGTSNDDGGANAGHVRVYNWNSGTSSWAKVGADIDGKSAGEETGWSVGLSHSGDTLVLGGPKSSVNGTRSGVVRVYDFAGSSAWTQVGADIKGEAAGDSCGFEVGISYNGRTIVAGAPRNNGGGADAGHIRIFKNLGAGWDQALTNDVDGNAAGEQFGRRASISGNGTRVAGGSREFSSNKGVVRIYTTAPNTCQDGTVTWDGGGRDEQWSTRQNWVGDKCPCDGADVVFDGTNSTKDAIIRDTISMASITATTKYRGRIRMEGDTSNLTVGSMILQGALFVADKGKAVINVGNLDITFNSNVFTGVNGINVSGLTYIRGGQLNPLAGTTINLNNLWVDGNGTINSPSNRGVVNLSGYLRLSTGAIFRTAGSTWNMTGNASHDLSYNTLNVLTATFNKLNISNAATFTNDNVIVTDTFRTIGSTANVSGGLFQAQGRVIIGSSNNTMTSLTFNAATGNQTLSATSAGALTGTPIVVNKATSGNLLLGSDINFGTLTLTKGHIDPNGNKATLTSNSISGASNASYIIGTAFVNKLNGAFSGNKITVPVGNAGNLKAIVIGNSGSKNDWKIGYVGSNPSSLNSSLHSSLSSISSVEYWSAQRLTADTFGTFIGLPASGSFDRVAWLDGSSWRSIGGSTSAGVITSTENNLFKSTGTYSLTQGVFNLPPPAPINVVVDKDMVSGNEIALENSNVNNQAAAVNNATTLSVYPNPARTSIQVVLPTQAVTFHLSDMAGRVVGSFPASMRQLDLSNLKNGMYLITTEVNGTKQSIRFVKQ